MWIAHFTVSHVKRWSTLKEVRSSNGGFFFKYKLNHRLKVATLIGSYV